MCMDVWVHVCVYVWVYYKTMGQVGKIIAQLRYGWVWMGMGLIVPPPLFDISFSWEVGDHCCVCVCTRQHLIIGEMSCLYV